MNFIKKGGGGGGGTQRICESNFSKVKAEAESLLKHTHSTCPATPLASYLFNCVVCEPDPLPM